MRGNFYQSNIVVSDLGIFSACCTTVLMKRPDMAVHRWLRSVLICLGTLVSANKSGQELDQRR